MNLEEAGQGQGRYQLLSPRPSTHIWATVQATQAYSSRAMPLADVFNIESLSIDRT